MIHKCRNDILNKHHVDIYELYPRNDIEAWIKYTQYNIIYDRMFLCKIQGIIHAPMPITPKKFPVIVKPIINLLGMGNKAAIIKNIDEFNDYWHCGHFWCEYIAGRHLSWDFVIKKGQIMFTCCFEGSPHSEQFGAFEFWKYIKKAPKPLDAIKTLICIYLHDYSGFLNVETINNRIIECHLRMGDIDQLPRYALKKSLLINVESYKGLKFNNIRIFKDIFLLPIWQKKYNGLDLQEVRNYLIDTWEQKIIESNVVDQYLFDDIHQACPGQYKRWFIINTALFQEGLYLKRSIEADLIQKFPHNTKN